MTKTVKKPAGKAEKLDDIDVKYGEIVETAEYGKDEKALDFFRKTTKKTQKNEKDNEKRATRKKSAADSPPNCSDTNSLTTAQLLFSAANGSKNKRRNSNNRSVTRASSWSRRQYLAPVQSLRADA